MKNFLKIFGIIALAAVIGFTMGCKTDDDGGSGDDNPFIGTWRSPEGGGYYVLVFTKFDWTITSPEGDVESGYYNYLPGDTSVTMTMTRGGSGTFNVSISGNSLSFGSRTYTKS